MPLTITNLASSSLAATKLAVGNASTTADRDSIANAATRSRGQLALERNLNRATQDTASANVQLSDVGRVRASFAEARDAARAIQPVASTAGGASTTRTVDELRASASRLVSGINNAGRISSEVAATQGTPNAVAPRNSSANPLPRPSPEQQRITQAASALSRSVTGATNANAGGDAQALAKIGITTAKDGKVSIDRQLFDAAVSTDRSGVEKTLSRLGARVETDVNQQLADSGNLGRANQIARARVSQAENRQAQVDEAQKILQQRSDSTPQNNASSNPFLLAGVSAYRGVFNL